MKVYLDNDVVSDQGRKLSPGEFAALNKPLKVELAALNKLLEIEKTGKIVLVTSEVTRREIERAGSSKSKIVRVYELLSKVLLVEAHNHAGEASYWDEHGGWSNPIFQDDSLWLRLLELGLHDIDAHHLTVAIYAGCDIFLTRDRKTILNRKSEVEAEFPIRLRCPSEFLAEVELLSSLAATPQCLEATK